MCIKSTDPRFNIYSNANCLISSFLILLSCLCYRSRVVGTSFVVCFVAKLSRLQQRLVLCAGCCTWIEQQSWRAVSISLYLPLSACTSPALMVPAQCPGLWSTCRMREPDSSADAPWGQRGWLWSQVRTLPLTDASCRHHHHQGNHPELLLVKVLSLKGLL